MPRPETPDRDARWVFATQCGHSRDHACNARRGSLGSQRESGFVRLRAGGRKMQHESSLYRRALAALAAVALITAGLLVAAAPAGAATTITGYRAIPTSIPGNVVSLGYEATQTSEFGDA